MSERLNRRNYYRILHVQPDAPAEILRSSYRALMRHLEIHPDRGGDHWNAALVNEAYEVLSDPARRAAYDELIDFMAVAQGRPQHPAEDDGDARDDGTAQEAAGEDASGTGDTRGSGTPSRSPAWVTKTSASTPGFDPTAKVHEVEHSACVFCGSRWTISVTNPPSIVCARCKSPLTLASAPILEDAGRRNARRIEREGDVRYYDDWPQRRGRPGRIVDISPMGMQFLAAEPLDRSVIVKIEGRVLDAVGMVADCRDLDGSYAIGVRFYTVRFNQAKGTFLSTEA